VAKRREERREDRGRPTTHNKHTPRLLLKNKEQAQKRTKLLLKTEN
jgi:hypothetical protein